MLIIYRLRYLLTMVQLMEVLRLHYLLAQMVSKMETKQAWTVVALARLA